MIGEFAPKPVVLPVPSAKTRNGGKLELNDRTLPILAVDPGGVSGWSLLQIPRTLNGRNIFDYPYETILSVASKTWVHGQVDCNNIDQGALILRNLCDEYPHAAVVFESFFIRQMAVDLSPNELIAVVRHHLWMKGRIMHMQQPALAKSLNDERLKYSKVYTSQGGLQHARDADRHALMMLRRCIDKNGAEMQKKLWPHVFKD